MSRQQLAARPDQAEIDRLSAALNRSFETSMTRRRRLRSRRVRRSVPALLAVPAPGPGGLRGPAAGGRRPENSSARVLRVVPTATGFVMEHEHTHRGETVEVARRVFLCEVEDGRIVDVVVYCNGGWDDELRARHAAEAPMVRP